MDYSSMDKESLMACIQQLEHEKDELRKDIEQLCTQQGGPSYIFLATRMHLQKTAGLEQQIEKLQKELAECTRDKLNFKEELSEASRIKAQLEKHYRAEVAKKLDAEQQLKCFQKSIASAFADRDQAFLEAEDAKEKAELLQQELHDCLQSLKESKSEALNAQELVAKLQADLAKQEHDAESCRQVVHKLYKIRQQCLGDIEDEQCSYDEKCTFLLQDSAETWSFHSHKEIISSLEEERDTLRRTIINLRHKLQVGLEIEWHLKRKVGELESKMKLFDQVIKNGISSLRQYHMEQKDSIMMLLDEGKSLLLSVVNTFQKQLGALRQNGEEQLILHSRDRPSEVNGGGGLNTSVVNVMLNKESGASINVTESAETTEVLSQALHEKVSALLLLQQQEERHFLEKNVNVALQQRLIELQECLNQVTKEKLEALMKLEYLERQIVKGRSSYEKSQDKVLATTSVKEGRLKNILRKTSIRRWISAADFDGTEGGFSSSGEGLFSFRRSSNNLDAARVKIENTTLNESMRSLEDLTSGIHKLRSELLKAKEVLAAENSSNDATRDLDDIINEANLVKIALGSAIPLSWSAEEPEASSPSSSSAAGAIVVAGAKDLKSGKGDTVSNAGFEMVELLLLAAQIMKERAARREIRDDS